MKKMILILLIAFLISGFLGLGACFAGAVDPCRMLAYQACAIKMQTVSTNVGPSGQHYCTTNPSTAAFKACEVEQRNLCKSGVSLDLTQKPCF